MKGGQGGNLFAGPGGIWVFAPAKLLGRSIRGEDSELRWEDGSALYLARTCFLPVRTNTSGKMPGRVVATVIVVQVFNLHVQTESLHYKK
jgi:hypothetical protein